MMRWKRIVAARPSGRICPRTTGGPGIGGVPLVNLERIRRAILARRSQALQAALMAAGLAAALALRLFLASETNLVPFATFLPVLLLSAVFLDAVWAVLAAVLALVLVNNVLVNHTWSAAGTVPVKLLLVYLVTITIIVGTGQLLRLILRENEAHLAQTEAFNAELQHRTKNMLQMIRALVARGVHAADPQAYYENLGGRIDALAEANALLRYGASESCDMGELVKTALAPFDRRRFVIDGLPVPVSREATTPLVMALHELCTNATKYGALSVDGGLVTLSWQAERGGPVRLSWVESGGPPVEPPQRRGLGSRLLTAQAGVRDVQLDWRPAGLRCYIELDGFEPPRQAK